MDGPRISRHPKETMKCACPVIAAKQISLELPQRHYALHFRALAIHRICVSWIAFAV